MNNQYYYEDYRFDFDTYHELKDDSQYPCETVPPEEASFLSSTKRVSEIYGRFIQQDQCTCIGCGYYEKSKLYEGFCCNPKSIWYLYKTGCRCDLRESKHLAQKHLRLQSQLKAAVKAAMKVEVESI